MMDLSKFAAHWLNLPSDKIPEYLGIVKEYQSSTRTVEDLWFLGCATGQRFPELGGKSMKDQALMCAFVFEDEIPIYEETPVPFSHSIGAQTFVQGWLKGRKESKESEGKHG